MDKIHHCQVCGEIATEAIRDMERVPDLGTGHVNIKPFGSFKFYCKKHFVPSKTYERDFFTGRIEEVFNG